MTPHSILIGLLCLVLGAVLDHSIRHWVHRRQLAYRFERARRGEQDAESLLLRRGYRIVGRQACAEVLLTVDGTEVRGAVRADYIVERRGRRAVVEVKTGGRAPDPSYVPTRRQLLEYAVVFPDHDVVLLDAEEGKCQVVEFPVTRGAVSLVPSFLLGAVLAAVGEWILLQL